MRTTVEVDRPTDRQIVSFKKVAFLLLSLSPALNACIGQTPAQVIEGPTATTNPDAGNGLGTQEPKITPDGLTQISPTQEATPVKETIPGLSIEVSKPDEQLLIDALNPFANAFQLTPEQSDKVKQGMQFVELKDKNNNPFVVATTPDVAETKDFDESGIPLLIAEQEEDGGWMWNIATKGRVAAKRGILDGSNFRAEQPNESKITLEQFNLSFIDGNASKLRNIHPGKDRFSLNGLIAEIKNASSTGNSVIVHGLIWGEKLNDKRVTWDDNMSSDEIIQEAVINHITEIVGAEGIKGSVLAYTLNEPGDEEDKLWQANPDYLRIATETIRAVDPNAKIILNIPDNFGGKYGDNKPELTSKLAIELYDAGLIDVVGIQGHIFGATSPTDQQVEATFNRFKTPDGVQIPIWITELDVNMKGVDDPSFQKQAVIIEKLVKKVIELGCRVINNWEIGDKNSWLEQPPFTGRRGPSANGTLFDDNLLPKPGYFTFLRALLQANSNH